MPYLIDENLHFIKGYTLTMCLSVFPKNFHKGIWFSDFVSHLLLHQLQLALILSYHSHALFMDCSTSSVGYMYKKVDLLQVIQ